MDLPDLDSETLDRILEMAWEDRTTFDAIKLQFGLTEPQTIALMRRELNHYALKVHRFLKG